MKLLIEKITKCLNENLILITVSEPRKAEEKKKYSIRPILLKDKLVFQSAAYTKTQVFHENLTKEQLVSLLEQLFVLYKQVQVKTVDGDWSAMISKKGKASIKESKKAVQVKMPDTARFQHNRKKKYILQEGMDIPFMKDLGVMTSEGKIVRTKYDKFRQMNRFLEYIEDILPHLPKDRELTIIDFGCGKSYLTFAMYYYLKILNDYPIRIIGLDLKKDVIRKCSKLAQSYRYDKLTFREGSIEDFEGVESVDMVVTLHACDTATDYALYKAIRWGAKVILSVPCCQHELNGQLKSDMITPITDYGILKERFSALATDGIRAKLLESAGYEAQILEFIDMEHTPKNLLIRAVKQKEHSAKAKKSVREMCEMFHFRPTLLKLLEEEQADAENS